MLRDADLTDRHDVERLRRSVAMLSPRVPCLDRDDGLAVLDALLDLLRRETTPSR